MRLLAASLLLLCVLSASAANRQETIQLRYLRAADLDRILLSSSQAFGKTPNSVAAPAARPSGSLLHSGSVAWTVDSSQNTLTVTGNEEAVEEVKRVAQLLDVAPRRISLHLEVLDGSERLRKELNLDGDEASSSLRTPAPDFRIALAAMIAQGKTSVLSSAHLSVLPYEAIRLIWAPQPDTVHILSATPRLDGNRGFNVAITPAVNLGKGLLKSPERTVRLIHGEPQATLLPTGEILLIAATRVPETSPTSAPSN